MSRSLRHLQHVAEHGIHSAGSAIGRMGCGGGGGPSSDPPEAVMKAITIALVISKLKDPDPLMEWIQEERGRMDAFARSDEAPVYGEAHSFQVTRLERLEQSPRFINALIALNAEMSRREKAEREHKRRLGYDV